MVDGMSKIMSKINVKDQVETLKQKLAEAPVLQYPDFGRPFILTTDASQFTIGSILS